MKRFDYSSKWLRCPKKNKRFHTNLSYISHVFTTSLTISSITYINSSNRTRWQQTTLHYTFSYQNITNIEMDLFNKISNQFFKILHTLYFSNLLQNETHSYTHNLSCLQSSFVCLHYTLIITKLLHPHLLKLNYFFKNNLNFLEK